MKKVTSLFLSLIIATTIIFTTTSYAYKNEQKCIIKIAQEDGRFTTLLTALDSAGLTETLKGNGPFTVFAPTDEAFKKLPAGTVENLLKPENKATLTDILLYHVAKDKLTAKDVVALNGKEIEMANGKKAKIEVKNGEVFIDGAKIVVTDITGKNGIIHVIDTVIIPK
ncbi:fasciclin domain-containing protein [Romboutsia sp.]|uniref:fasciclin domain-containing protein n=1 Tax=Romboutsia sp. TaxID=1965302 RepID=UPI003F392D93